VKQYINLNPPVHADEATDEVASDGAKSYHMSSNEEDAAQAKAILSSHLEIIPNSEAAAKALQKLILWCHWASGAHSSGMSM